MAKPPMRIAFAGFRHAHIEGLYALAHRHPATEIVGASEPDPATRQRLADGGAIQLTRSDYPELLAVG